jgi:hypothetical protein
MRVGCEKGYAQDQEHRNAHRGINGWPADPRGGDERECPPDKRRYAIAELVDGREYVQRGDLVRDIHAPGIDGDVLGRRRQGAKTGEEGKPAKGALRIERREENQDDANQRLRHNQPALTAAEAAEARQGRAVYDRRPEKFEGVDETDQRKDPHRLKVDLRRA